MTDVSKLPQKADDAQAQAQAEPVAWQYLGTSSIGPFNPGEWKWCADHNEAIRNGYEVRPLYTHPQAPAADVAAANIATLEAQLAAEKKLSEAISRDCNECANQRNDALSRLAEVEGDARRYRWLRNNPSARLYEAGGYFRVEKFSLRWEPSVDTAIDAAITASQEEGNHAVA